MVPCGKVNGALNRYFNYMLLVFGITLVALIFAALFIGFSAAQAASLAVPVSSETELHLTTQDDLLSAANLHSTNTASVLVATAADFWPMEYISGTALLGHDIDLMNALGTEMGVTVVYTIVPFGVILDGLIIGDYDAVISSLTVTPDREDIIDFTLPYVTLVGTENLAIAVQQGDDTLRIDMNAALRQLEADGTLQSILDAIAADVPEWTPGLPDWPYVYLPFVAKTLDG